MPDADLYCEVRTLGGTYRDWLSVNVAQSFDQSWSRSFALTCAEPSAASAFRLKPGDRVDIALAGQVLIKEGYITQRQAAYDGARHAVQVSGFSKAGITEIVSAQSGTGQFRGYKIDAIANSVLKPLGLKFEVKDGPKGWDTPFPQVMIRHGETPFALISRLCNQRGLWIEAEADGTLTAGTKVDGSGAQFVEGVNILSASCMIEMPGAAELITSSQMTGSDSLFGRKASEISAKSTITGGIPGTKQTYLAEMPLDQKGAELRTNMQAQAIESARLRVNLTYQGWLKPDGSLWKLKEPVTVKSPMLFPTKSGQMELKLWGYTHSQSESGTTTTLDLVNENAFGVRAQDAKENDGWYNPGATPAVPEERT
ncbi:phage baseplate assembly protein [Methylobacterium dankookense]|uniref:Mu-like prophage tail protein gpP n=1 Tax=Methylobacterium dankookense TaxID=560405 RepID=A0A564G7X5_9HYPH|nr:hypothetical protein [Methylobacterium dankookense]GJD58354.1 hypothetical protein IFDJLNFL_4273 [Methylobacterium dankookense]VUF15641.1 hypothetical protein MTDSW087_05385 [Methylobacterium dankookense]